MKVYWVWVAMIIEADYDTNDWESRRINLDALLVIMGQNEMHMN